MVHTKTVPVNNQIITNPNMNVYNQRPNNMMYPNQYPATTSGYPIMMNQPHVYSQTMPGLPNNGPNQNMIYDSNNYQMSSIQQSNQFNYGGQSQMQMQESFNHYNPPEYNASSGITHGESNIQHQSNYEPAFQGNNNNGES